MWPRLRPQVRIAKNASKRKRRSRKGRMTDANQVRINELARELEVKAKAIIDLLPGYGVTEKKTHSSSIPADVAEKVRAKLQGAAEAEAQAESAAKAEKEAKDAAAKAARTRPAAAPAATAPAATKPSAPSAAPVAKPAAPAALAPATAPAAPKAPAPAPMGTPTAVPPATRSSAPAGPATGAPATTPIRPAAPAAQPGTPSAARPASPVGKHLSAVRPPAAAPGAAPARPGTPARTSAQARPLPTGNRGPLPTGNRGPLPSTAPGARSGGPRPGQPMRPQQPGQGRTHTPRTGGPGGAPNRPFEQRRGAMPTGTRPGPRAPGRPGMLPAFPEKMPPKAEPGKPLYTRKPPQRQRPVADKREQEGERKLHPTRQRPGAGRSVAAVIAPPEPRAPREVTITEGITIRELAEKLDVRAKELLKTLLDRGVFASINQALDVPTATTLAEAFSGVVSVVSL